MQAAGLLELWEGEEEEWTIGVVVELGKRFWCPEVVTVRHYREWGDYRVCRGVLSTPYCSRLYQRKAWVAGHQARHG